MHVFDSSDSSDDEEDARLRPIRYNRNAQRLTRIIDASDKPDGIVTLQSKTVTNNDITEEKDVLNGIVLHSLNLKRFNFNTTELPVKFSQNLILGLHLIKIFQDKNDCHV